MNKKGSTFMLGIMFAVMLFITAVVFIEPIKDQVTQARTEIDCTSGSLTTGESMTCIVVDSYLPIYIGIAIAIALAAIGIKKQSSDA